MPDHSLGFARRVSMSLRVCWPLLALLALLVLTAAAYRPGLWGGFMLDDFPNIVVNPAMYFDAADISGWWQATLSGIAGWGGRPVVMLSFAVDVASHGMNPFWFKLTNLLIHLFNIALVFVLTQRLLENARPSAVEPRARIGVALAVAAVWGLHPLQMSSVLYAVQRMTSLSAMFVLLALLAYLWLRRAVLARDWKQCVMAAVAVSAAWLAAFFSKENAALLPLLCLSLEVIIAGDERSRWRRGVMVAMLVLVLLPVVLYFTMHGFGFLEGAHRYRNFTTPERLMTEARVLWLYLRWIVIPDTDQMGLYHDDIPLSHGLLDPASTLVALGGLAGLVVLAWVSRRKIPWIAGGLLFFFAGHLMESTVIPLEIAFEHRNYLPSYGIVLLIAILVYRTLAWRPAWLLGLGLATSLSLATVTYARAIVWGDPLRLAMSEAANHPLSPRANYDAGRIYWTAMQQPDGDRKTLRPLAIRSFRAAMSADDCNLSGPLGLLASEDRPNVIDDEIIPILKLRIARCTITLHDADNLSFVMRCAGAGLCTVSRESVADLATRFLASDRLNSQGREMVRNAMRRVVPAGAADAGSGARH